MTYEMTDSGARVRFDTMNEEMKFQAFMDNFEKYSVSEMEQLMKPKDQ